MQAHVICCNGSVEAVVIGSYTKADLKKEELAYGHYTETKQNWRSYKCYRERCYWHFHTVEVF